MDITTADGVSRGIRGRRVNRWRAIPFAAPPVGDLRFRAPQPVEPWTGVRDAVAFANAPMQPKFATRLGPRTYQSTSEDCLTLNVVTPTRPSTTPRPVMVFIYGGGYVIGSSATGIYSGGRLVTRGDIVYVSLNYRLGPFGYVDFSQFSTTERQFDVNLGLRDQVAALRWVQRNIAAFGGDPDNVTIFGESAGGGSVTTLLATPAAKGLFHRAIAQSPPVDWVVGKDDAADVARRTVDALGATRDTAADILAEVDGTRLRRAVAKVAITAMRGRAGMPPVAPVVDGDVLPVAPLQAMADGAAHPVPLLIGTNRDEGTLFAKWADELPTNTERLDRLFGSTDPTIRARLTRAYPSGPDGAGAVKLGGDYTFWRPVLDTLEAHGTHAPTYNYRFDFAPRMLQRMGLGATHAWELFAVFGYGDSTLGRAITAPGGRRALRAVTRQVQDNWISFARTGAPLPSWPRYTTQTRRTMVFDTHSRVVADLDRERRLAWASFGGPASSLAG